MEDMIVEDVTDQLFTDATKCKLIYLSGPMTKPGFELSQKIAIEVSRINGLLVSGGWTVVNPWGSVLCEDSWDLPHDVWVGSDLEMLEVFALAKAAGLADEIAILMLSFDSDGKIDYHSRYVWQDSDGACTEYEFSQELGCPLTPYYWHEDATSFALISLNGGDC